MKLYQKYPDKIWRDKLNSDNRIQGAQILDQDIMRFYMMNQFVKSVRLIVDLK